MSVSSVPPYIINVSGGHNLAICQKKLKSAPSRGELFDSHGKEHSFALPYKLLIAALRHGQQPAPRPVPQPGDLGGGAELVGQVDHVALPVAGHFFRQGPHVGDDDVLLLVGQPAAQLGGVFGGGLGVGEALVALVLAVVVGVIEVQVVEQPAPGGGHVVHAPAPGQAEGHVGHEDGVLVAVHAGVVGDGLHGAHLVAHQQVADAV